MSLQLRRLAGRESEHSRIDGDVPAARVAALQPQRPRGDKSTGHEQGDQEAGRRRSSNPETQDDPSYCRRCYFSLAACKCGTSQFPRGENP